MKRGRHSDDYSREEFRMLVCNRRDFLNLSLVALAELAQVNRGSLSQVLRGQRPCGRTDRAALIHALGLGDNVSTQFLTASPVHTPKPDLILLDPPTSPHPPLEKGQRFLICALFPEALREFVAVYRAAADRRDYVLQSDAAARIAWVYYEMGLSADSLKWVGVSIRLIERFAGVPLSEIIASVQPNTHSALCPIDEGASHVLSRAMEIRCKLLVERILYHGEPLRFEADNAFAQSLALDHHLEVPAQLGHHLRWQAMLMVSGFEPRRKEAEYLLSASEEMFPQGSLGEAYVARDRGVACWRTEQYAKARNSLLLAVERLSSFADARALGPALCALSKVTLQGGADRRMARRYALAAGILHPHGFVLSNAREHLEGVSERGLRSDIEDLFSERKPFDVLNPVLSRLTNGSAKDVRERLKRNLSRVLDFGSRLGR
jgi:hypothetical protein